MKNNKTTHLNSAIDDAAAHDFPHLGKEFDGIEHVGTSNEGSLRIFHHRMKRHLINTLNAIETNQGTVNPIYDPKALGAAYKELIEAWDHEPSREAVLEKLSANEENMLKPAFKGLGDIVHGSDEELFGIVDFGFNNLDGLGKKDRARKHATGEETATKKRGVFTKIKTASKHVKEEVRKQGGNVKKAAKKVGHAVVKFNPVTIAARGSFLLAMKTNVGKIASRVYWGHFSLQQAKHAGITPEYWYAANKGWNNLKHTFADKLKGDENVLFRAVSQGRAKYERERVNGLSGLGLIDPQTIALVLKLLKPLFEALNNSFQGKQETEDSEPETSFEFDDVVNLVNEFSTDESSNNSSEESTNGVLGMLT